MKKGEPVPDQFAIRHAALTEAIRFSVADTTEAEMLERAERFAAWMTRQAAIKQYEIRRPGRPRTTPLPTNPPLEPLPVVETTPTSVAPAPPPLIVTASPPQIKCSLCGQLVERGAAFLAHVQAHEREPVTA